MTTTPQANRKPSDAPLTAAIYGYGAAILILAAMVGYFITTEHAKMAAMILVPLIAVNGALFMGAWSKRKKALARETA